MCFLPAVVPLLFEHDTELGQLCLALLASAALTCVVIRLSDQMLLVGLLVTVEELLASLPRIPWHPSQPVDGFARQFSSILLPSRQRLFLLFHGVATLLQALPSLF